MLHRSTLLLRYFCTFAVIVAIAILFVCVGIKKDKEGLVNYLASVKVSTSESTTTILGSGFVPYVSSTHPKSTYDVLAFGAVGDGVTDDTEAINKALLTIHEVGGGMLVIPHGKSGDYMISSPLIIYSNTSLVVDDGVAISLEASSNSNMLIDASHHSGDLAVPSTMHDISVQGGIWARGVNFGTKNNVHSIILGGNNITVQGATFTSSGGKYAVLIQNATHFTVRDLFMNNTFSDGVHVQGPARFGLIQNIRGKAGDDMVSITPCDWVSYTWGNEGDVADIDIDSIELDNQSIANGVKVLGGTVGTKVLKSDRINISNVTGSTSMPFMSAIYLGDDNAEPNTKNGQVDNIAVHNLSVNLSDGTPNSLIKIEGSATSLEIPNITISDITFSSDMSAMVSNTGKVKNLSVQDVQGNTKTDATNAILQNTGIPWAHIDHLAISNINLAYAVRGGNLIFSPLNEQGLNDVMLKDVHLYNVADVADIGTKTNFNISGAYLAANRRLLLLNPGAIATIQSATNVNASSTSSVLLGDSSLIPGSSVYPTNIIHSDITAYVDRGVHLGIRFFNLLKSHIFK